MESWSCPACGLPHALKPDVRERRCFKCGAELERDERPVDPAVERTATILKHSECTCTGSGKPFWSCPVHGISEHDL